MYIHKVHMSCRPAAHVLQRHAYHVSIDIVAYPYFDGVKSRLVFIGIFRRHFGISPSSPIEVDDVV